MNHPSHVRAAGTRPTAPRTGTPRRPAPARESVPARPRTATIGCVIPCYNYAQFVGEAIDSALHQSDPYDVVVVVDDGSTDDSLAVIERYGDRVEVVAQPNRGVLAACLAGIDRVSTDYVHVLDADDLTHPRFVERVRPLLATQPVKVQCQVEAVDAAGVPNASVFPSYGPGYDTAAMREDNRVLGLYQCPPTSGNVFHVPTLRRLGLDKEDPHLPLDGVGCAVMPYLGTVVTLAEPLVAYRLHGASLSSVDLPPSPEVLEQEMAMLVRTWEVSARILGFDEPPYGADLPLYLLERRHLVRALRGQRPDAAETATYLRRLSQSHLPAWQRTLQGAWICGLHLPSRPLRRRLVDLRRSGSNRPAWMRRIIASVRG